MSCEKVREVVEGAKSLAKHEEVPYLRHLRVCRECRLAISDDKRRHAIESLVLEN